MSYSLYFPTKTNHRNVSTGSKAQWTQALSEMSRSRTEPAVHCLQESDVHLVMSEAEPRRSGKKNGTDGTVKPQALATQETSTLINVLHNPERKFNPRSTEVLQNVSPPPALINQRLPANQWRVGCKAVEPISFTVIKTYSKSNKNVSVCLSLDRMVAGSSPTHTPQLLRGCPLHDPHPGSTSCERNNEYGSNAMVTATSPQLAQYCTKQRTIRSEMTNIDLLTFQCFISSV